jgi:hypothetical protein
VFCAETTEKRDVARMKQEKSERDECRDECIEDERCVVPILAG